MHSLGDLAVISELKVSSSGGAGLDHKEVAQDAYKLSLLLEQAEIDKHPADTAVRLSSIIEGRTGGLVSEAGSRPIPNKPAKEARSTSAKPAAKSAGARVKKAPAEAQAASAPSKKAASARKSSMPAGKSKPSKNAPSEKKTLRLGAARTRASSAPMSTYFDRSRNRARKMLKDPEALKRIAEESDRSGATRSGQFAEVMDDFRTCVRLVVAYARGNYREIPADSLALVVAGLIYVVSPIDLIPDGIPGAGFLDDAVVVGFVIRSVRDELDQFRAWETGHDPSA